jgi:hypothetical protein
LNATATASSSGLVGGGGATANTPTDNNSGAGSNGQDNEMMVLGVSTSILVLLVIALVLVFMAYRRREGKSDLSPVPPGVPFSYQDSPGNPNLAFSLGGAYTQSYGESNNVYTQNYGESNGAYVQSYGESNGAAQNYGEGYSPYAPTQQATLNYGEGYSQSAPPQSYGEGYSQSAPPQSYGEGHAGVPYGVHEPPVPYQNGQWDEQPASLFQRQGLQGPGPIYSESQSSQPPMPLDVDYRTMPVAPDIVPLPSVAPPALAEQQVSDPLLEAIMRQTQMGLFFLPGRDTREAMGD